MSTLRPPESMPRLVRRYLYFPLRFVFVWIVFAIIFAAIPPGSTWSPPADGGSGVDEAG